MNTIKMVEWMAFHPYKVPKSVDYNYLKIANKIHDSWRLSLLKNEFEEDVLKIVSLTVAAYFEDVVSYTGLWQAFTRRHKEMYGKYLPFHDTSTDDYYDDEVNPQDVAFLIWSVLQKENIGTFINPENPGIMDIAEKMYNVLNEEFEKVSVNEYFLDYIQDAKHYEDFFAFRQLAAWLYYNSYLLGVENTYLLEEQLDNIDEYSSMSPEQIEYAIRSELIFSQKTGPLALPLKNWFANMLKGMGMEKEIAVIEAIENHESDYFRIKNVDEMHFHVVDTNENEYSILRSSFYELSKRAIASKILIATLVKYDGEWHVNGMSSWTDEEGPYYDLLERKKGQASLRKEVYEKVLKMNDGSPLAYFKNVSEMQKWLNKVLEVDGYVNANTMNDKENVVVFFSPKADICVIPKVGYYIKDPKNPIFNINRAKKEGIAMLVDSRSCPSEMYHYLFENDMLPDTQINSLFGEERARELIRDNTDFVARFFKWNEY